MANPITIGGVRNAEFLLSEAAGERSRGLFNIPSGQGVLVPGTILKADGSACAIADVANAVAVLYGGVDATSAAQDATAIVRDAEVHGELLAWPVGATDANKLAYADALENKGIIVRWTARPAGLVTDEPLSDG